LQARIYSSFFGKGRTNYRFLDFFDIDGNKYSKDNISQAMQDAILCLEMPLFAWLHWYAYPWTDFNDKRLSSRISFLFAVRDACGFKDIISDTKITFSGIFSETKIDSRNDEDLPLLNETSPNNEFSESIQFELDGTEEEDYNISRKFVFGDYHYPVIHDEWMHPPIVQQLIDRNAAEFYRAIAPATSSKTLLRWDDDNLE
jgi:hypothetical protein